MKRQRLKALIEEIEADRSRYNQYHYTSGLTYRYADNEPKVKLTKDTVINCDTTGCIAGLASFRWAPVGTKFWESEIELPSRELVTYQKYGTKMLGLTKKEAYYLFGGDRSWEEILAFSDMKKEQRTELVKNY